MPDGGLTGAPPLPFHRVMRRAHIISTLVATTALLAASEAGATNYSLWIHGRNTSQSTQPGNYGDFSYWGSSGTAAGVNKKAVNWNGVGHISDQNYRTRDALDCFCTGSNWCYIAVHSAGDMHIGYALALYGNTSRNIKTPGAGANGVCTNAGGTQTGWNIKWVNVASGAGGGSELANVGAWAVGDVLTDDLKTGTARTLYDHNQTRGLWFYMFAGAKGTLYSGTLPGQDDEVVAYHSTGGVSKTGSFCNPGDLFCDGNLNTGSGNTSNGVAKWNLHTVDLADTGESYNHYSGGSWGGIVGPVRTDMVNYAK
jgi:hypothetical protein